MRLKTITPMQKILEIPKQYQEESLEWCAGYMQGYRDGVNNERSMHLRLPLSEVFPKEYGYGKRNKNGKKIYTMTDEAYDQHDNELKEQLIKDIYRYMHFEIVKRYKLCFWAAFNAVLRGRRVKEHNIFKIFDAVDKMLQEIGDYIHKDDRTGLTKWLQRNKVDEQIAKDTFDTIKSYDVEDKLGIDDLDFFNLEG